MCCCPVPCAPPHPQVLPLFSRHDDTRFEVNGVQLDFIVDQFLYRAAEALATRQRRTANFTALPGRWFGSCRGNRQREFILFPPFWEPFSHMRTT